MQELPNQTKDNTPNLVILFCLSLVNLKIGTFQRLEGKILLGSQSEL